jgi:hypothetical protein
MGQSLLNDQLNQQQQDMLRLFKNPMPEEDYIQMRRLAVQLLSKQLDSKLDEWEIENGVTTQDYNDLAQRHLRKAIPKN